MLPLFSRSQEKHTSFKEAPTSLSRPPYHIDQHGHLYMCDPLPQPSSELSVPLSPTRGTRSIKDWLMTSRSWSTAVKKKVANVFPSNSAGSRGSRTTSESSMPTSKIPSAPSTLSRLASPYIASPYLSP